MHTYLVQHAPLPVPEKNIFFLRILSSELEHPLLPLSPLVAPMHLWNHVCASLEYPSQGRCSLINCAGNWGGFSCFLFYESFLLYFSFEQLQQCTAAPFVSVWDKMLNLNFVLNMKMFYNATNNERAAGYRTHLPGVKMLYAFCWVLLKSFVSRRYNFRPFLKWCRISSCFKRAYIFIRRLVASHATQYETWAVRSFTFCPESKASARVVCDCSRRCKVMPHAWDGTFIK